jgi:inhibitor of KinA
MDAPDPVVTNVRCTPLSESAIVVEFGERIDREILGRVWGFARYLDRHPVRGMTDYVTAFTTVTIFFDPLHVDTDAIRQEISSVIDRRDWGRNQEGRTVEIPVCYDAEFGPDLEYVARQSGLSTQEVIDIHAQAEYLVYLIGFAPGFPYLGGMSPRIAVPRREAPRLVVPAGSVGIAGQQTGIYPIETPGGWQLIGRTPLRLFCPADRPPSLLCAGDTVKIRQITRDDFRAWTESH